MRQREPLVGVLDVAEQQEVDVERARAVARAAEHPAVLGLDRLARVEQLERLERGRDARRRVQEVGLVEDLPHRLGLIERRDGLDLHPMQAEQLDRSSQVRLAVADIGAQAEVADPAHRSSSTSSPSSSPNGRSWTTSTAISSIASGSGGSGFDARTRTDSEPKRSARRSAIT